jgi:hypothetical protein
VALRSACNTTEGIIQWQRNNSCSRALVLRGSAADGLHHKGLKLSDADKARISESLTGGQAAVGVLAKMRDAPAVQAQLTGLGGTTSEHDVVDDAALAEAGK